MRLPPPSIPDRGMRLSWLLRAGVVAIAILIALPCVASAPVTTATLQNFLAAFNRHDLDGVMSFFADDCVLEMPRGPEPYGQRYVGKIEVRKALAGRLEGIPDLHYGDDSHWVAGNHGVSQWTLTGTTREGQKIKVRGCDLLEFRNGKIIRKDSFWKLVEQKR
jgi:ketosteroid isomerase-like protein